MFLSAFDVLFSCVYLFLLVAFRLKCFCLAVDEIYFVAFVTFCRANLHAAVWFASELTAILNSIVMAEHCTHTHTFAHSLTSHRNYYTKREFKMDVKIVFCSFDLNS